MSDALEGNFEAFKGLTPGQRGRILIQIVYVYNERRTISGLIFIVVVELDKLGLVGVLVSLV